MTTSQRLVLAVCGLALIPFTSGCDVLCFLTNLSATVLNPNYLKPSGIPAEAPGKHVYTAVSPDGAYVALSSLGEDPNTTDLLTLVATNPLVPQRVQQMHVGNSPYGLLWITGDFLLVCNEGLDAVGGQATLQVIHLQEDPNFPLTKRLPSDPNDPNQVFSLSPGTIIGPSEIVAVPGTKIMFVVTLRYLGAVYLINFTTATPQTKLLLGTSTLGEVDEPRGVDITADGSLVVICNYGAGANNNPALALAQALIAANLNLRRGVTPADPNALAQTIAASDAWLAVHRDPDGRLPYRWPEPDQGPDDAAIAEANDLTTALNAYNNSDPNCTGANDMTSLALADALIAAKLNLLRGAPPTDPNALAQTITDSDAWLATHRDPDGRLPYRWPEPSQGPDANAVAEAKALTTALNAYNNNPNCTDANDAAALELAQALIAANLNLWRGVPPADPNELDQTIAESQQWLATHKDPNLSRDPNAVAEANGLTAALNAYNFDPNCTDALDANCPLTSGQWALRDPNSPNDPNIANDPNLNFWSIDPNAEPNLSRTIVLGDPNDPNDRFNYSAAFAVVNAVPNNEARCPLTPEEWALRDPNSPSDANIAYDPNGNFWPIDPNADSNLSRTMVLGDANDPNQSYAYSAAWGFVNMAVGDPNSLQNCPLTPAQWALRDPNSPNDPNIANDPNLNYWPVYPNGDPNLARTMVLGDPNDPNERYAYSSAWGILNLVVDAPGEVDVYNMITQQIIARVITPPRPKNVRITPDQTTAVVTCAGNDGRTGSVVLINMPSLSLTTQRDFDYIPNMVALHPTGGRAFISGWSGNSIARINLKAVCPFSILPPADTELYPIFDQPAAIGFGPQMDTLWCGSRATGEVAPLDVFEGAIRIGF
jgi:hypothetical protein